MICRECGSDMNKKVIQSHKGYLPKLVRFECACGHMESEERTFEKIENDYGPQNQ